jgi:hypothetical protein
LQQDSSANGQLFLPIQAALNTPKSELTIVAAVPASADLIADFPSLDAFSNSGNSTNDFVTWDDGAVQGKSLG